MFYKDSPQELAAVLDRMSVPLFVAERSLDDEQFTFVFVNAALELASGLCASDIVGKTPAEIFGARKGAEIVLKWAICARNKQVITYSLDVEPPNGSQRWDTTMQHIPMPDGRDRVVGASTRILCRDVSGAEVLCFDDIRYHAAIADIQLNNLATVFEDSRSGCHTCGIPEDNVDRVVGLCRSVRRAIADIRHAADRAYSGPQHDRQAALHAVNSAGGHMLRALEMTSGDED